MKPSNYFPVKFQIRGQTRSTNGQGCFGPPVTTRNPKLDPDIVTIRAFTAFNWMQYNLLWGMESQMHEEMDPIYNLYTLIIKHIRTELFYIFKG